MSDIYADEWYNPSFQISSGLSASTPAPNFMPDPQNDIFAQRLHAANRQHLTSQEHMIPKTISPKDVDLVYFGSDEDEDKPLFPPQQ